MLGKFERKLTKNRHRPAKAEMMIPVIAIVLQGKIVLIRNTANSPIDGNSPETTRKH